MILLHRSTMRNFTSARQVAMISPKTSRPGSSQGIHSLIFLHTNWWLLRRGKEVKGKGFPSSHTRYRALGLEQIPVYRQSARRWLWVIHPAVGCHYFPPGLRLPSQSQSITAPRPLPSNTAWWQRHIGVNNLPKVVTQLLTRVGFELNPRPVDRKSSTLPCSPPCHLRGLVLFCSCVNVRTASPERQRGNVPHAYTYTSTHTSI